MAAVPLTATTFPTTIAGLNITDTAVATLVSGVGNGVVFTYDGNDLLVLRNDTGGPAVYSIVAKTPTSMSAYGITVPSATVSVATGKDRIIRLADIFASTAGTCTVECDVAGKCFVLDR